MEYIIYKTHHCNEHDDNYKCCDGVKVLGHRIRYYHSSISNNALFEHPLTETLNDFIHGSVIGISNFKDIKGSGSQWTFYSY